MARILILLFAVLQWGLAGAQVGHEQFGSPGASSASDSEHMSLMAPSKEAKSIASGLYMDGAWVATYGAGYSTVTVLLPYIYNKTAYSTGPLRLSYWAVSSFPGRGLSFTGYRLATFTTFAPLAPWSYYYGITRFSSMLLPPDGTYWMVLALEEYAPGYCASTNGYCLVDSIPSEATRTFGAQPVAFLLSVDRIGTGSGTVTSLPAGINCGALCFSNFISSSSVALTATPSAGSIFTGWAGACSGVTTCQLVVSGNSKVWATFSALPNPASVSQFVQHYYQAVLRRSPDPGGQQYWESEAVRMAGLGANVSEAWYAMAKSFFDSQEYKTLDRDTANFVTDLYGTFFNRPPDAGGLAYWSGQMNAGLPREVALASFMFSPEFTSYTQGIFGNTSVRAEINAVMDFYRGLLSRMPDSTGFNFWVEQFRSAQCQGAAAVAAQAESISSLFTSGAEYTQKQRTNSQYVGDLYNAFLRRGGDLSGVQYWVDQLNTGARTREQVRQQFVASPEFNVRVNAIVSQGCLH